MYLRLYACSGACESVGSGGMQCLYVWEVAVVCECVGIGGMQWLLSRMEVTVIFECENLGGMQCLLSMAVSEFVWMYWSVSDFKAYMRNGNVGIYSLFYTNVK